MYRYYEKTIHNDGVCTVFRAPVKLLFTQLAAREMLKGYRKR